MMDDDDELEGPAVSSPRRDVSGLDQESDGGDGAFPPRQQQQQQQQQQEEEEELPRPPKPTVDECFVSIGDFGRIQKEIAAVGALAGIAGGMVTLSPIFVNGSADVAHNTTLTASGYMAYPTIAAEWKLSAAELAVPSMLYFLGWFIGAFLAGWLSDQRWGRRRTYRWFAWATVFSVVLSSFAPWYPLYALLRLVSGVSVGGIILASVVLTLETSPSRLRARIGVLLTFAFSVGLMILVAGAAALPSRWRALSVLTGLFPALLVIVIEHGWVVESPRWLLSRAMHSEAIAVLRVMSLRNSRVLPSPLELAIPPEALAAAAAAAAQPTSPSSFWLFAAVRALAHDTARVCRPSSLRCISSITAFNWFTCSFVYYGLTLNTPNLNGNLYTNAALMALLEIPSYIIAYGLLHYTGRRTSFVLTMGCTALGAIGFAAVPQSTFKDILGFLCKIAITSAFSIIYVQSSEVFPTSLRSTGLGLGSQAARFGGIVAPLILSSSSTVLPFIFFACLTFCSTLLTMWLPETKGLTLPESVDDVRVTPCCGWRPSLKRHARRLDRVVVRSRKDTRDNNTADGGAMPLVEGSGSSSEEDLFM